MLHFFRKSKEISPSIDSIINKYKDDVVKSMSDPESNYIQQTNIHTKYIAECVRGREKAKEYVRQQIFTILTSIVLDNDIEILEDLIKEELNYFLNEEFEQYDLKSFKLDEERMISYYQLLNLSMSDKQKNYLETLKAKINDKDMVLEILADEIYKKEYGLDIVENLKDMKLNNIEIQDTKKIRIEVADGNWYTLSDYKFNDNNTIRIIAKRLVVQKSGGDLTEDECEREGQLLDGSRLTIALKPASTMDTIFIKMFDNSIVTADDMIKNGTLTEDAVECLKIVAKGRLNTVFIGGVNCGKTTLLKVYMGFMPAAYKIGMVDASKDTDLATLYPEKDVITLYETPTYDMNTQFSKLLRMNRQILGITEARSFEVEQLIKGMLRGNSGSTSTLHTTNVKDLIDNMAWMCLENGVPQDMNVLRSRIASAIDIVPRVKQFSNGARRLDDISEVVATGDLYKPFEIRKIFQWDYDKNMLVRNPNYIPSDDLLDKLRYYGCSEDEIRRFQRG